MISVEELKTALAIPEDECWPEVSYEELADLHGDVLTMLTLDEYQGDLLFIIRAPDGAYGYIHTGYGSCLGCDALMSITSDLGYEPDQAKAWQELAELVEELRPKQWRSAAEMLAWLRQHDWEGDYLGRHAEEIKVWIEGVVAPLLT